MQLDARLFEPTADGLTHELGTPTEKLHELAPRVFSLIDSYEHLRVLDTWIQQNLLPPAGHCAGVIEPEWQGHFAPLALGPLDGAESAELLRRQGYPEVGRAALEGVNSFPCFSPKPSPLTSAVRSRPPRLCGGLLAALAPTLDAVHDAVAFALRARDPGLHATLRGSA